MPISIEGLLELSPKLKNDPNPMQGLAGLVVLTGVKGYFEGLWVGLGLEINVIFHSRASLKFCKKNIA